MTSPTFSRSAALADQQRGDLGAVEHRAAAHRQADARADEEAAEDRRQQQVGRDVGKVHGGERRPTARRSPSALRIANARPICR